MTEPLDQNNLIRQRLFVTGVVQGVGFRPFVYGLAVKFGLAGFVFNTSAGVTIEVEGPAGNAEEFSRRLVDEAPPLARIEKVHTESLPPKGETSFEILASQPEPGAFQPISPDVAICDDCLREIFDPADRRYHYPFTNCTNCGPRFTIIQDIPYDRPKTTMAAFEMCPECYREYQKPLDRRFHAQPVACPVCGPQVWLEIPGRLVGAEDPAKSGEAAIQTVQQLLAQGKIVAVWGAFTWLAMPRMRRRSASCAGGKGEWTSRLP
jgi:hydrogenase maturation protein HypF